MNACSLWFDRLGPWDWHQCCIAHDFAYRTGNVPKLVADLALEHCVDAILPGMGVVMFIGVSSIIGWAFWLNARRKTP